MIKRLPPKSSPLDRLPVSLLKASVYFCGFQSVTVNSVYKLQFFTFTKVTVVTIKCYLYAYRCNVTTIEEHIFVNRPIPMYAWFCALRMRGAVK